MTPLLDLAADTRIPHGALHCRKHYGCDCEPCKAAVRDYRADLRARRYALRITGANGRPLALTNFAGTPLPHSSATTYREWGCRCDLCTATATTSSRAHKRTTRKARP